MELAKTLEAKKKEFEELKGRIKQLDGLRETLLSQAFELQGQVKLLEDLTKDEIVHKP